jgi:hypothetical protein
MGKEYAPAMTKELMEVNQSYGGLLFKVRRDAA